METQNINPEPPVKGRLKGNWSPEVEVRRLAALRKAIKGKRATDEQREARAEGLRRAHAEGRIKVVRTPETTKKIADKLRGRKRPEWVVKKIAEANRGKKRTEAVREAMSRRVREGFKEGKYRMPDEKRKAVMENLHRAARGRVVSQEQRDRQSKTLLAKQRKEDPDHAYARVAAMRGREQKADATKKGPTNQRSLTAEFRSPSNVTYKAHNIAQFVRDHEHLFIAEDVQWDAMNKGGRCRAYNGLLSLTCKHADTRGSWKGWTLVSLTEVFYNSGEDLLDRSLDPDAT